MTKAGTTTIATSSTQSPVRFVLLKRRLFFFQPSFPPRMIGSVRKTTSPCWSTPSSGLATQLAVFSGDSPTTCKNFFLAPYKGLALWHIWHIFRADQSKIPPSISNLQYNTSAPQLWKKANGDFDSRSLRSGWSGYFACSQLYRAPYLQVLQTFHFYLRDATRGCNIKVKDYFAFFWGQNIWKALSWALQRYWPLIHLTLNAFSGS